MDSLRQHIVLRIRYVHFLVSWASRVREPPGPPGPAGDPCASSARVRAEMGGALRTMSSSLESRANRGPSAILFPGAASLPPSRLVQADTRTHPKGRKGCGGGASPEIKVKRQAHFRIPMLGLGGSQELRERRRVLCCIDIDSENSLSFASSSPIFPSLCPV